MIFSASIWFIDVLLYLNRGIQETIKYDSFWKEQQQNLVLKQPAQVSQVRDLC